MKPYTKKEAQRYFAKGRWKKMSAQQKVALQLFQDHLCMPFDVFHEALQKVLGRSITLDEFTDARNLKAEYYRQLQKMNSFLNVIV